MTTTLRPLGLAAVCTALFVSIGHGDDAAVKGSTSPRPAAKKSTRTAEKKAVEPAEISLLDAARSGAAMVEAEGLGDGRINIAVTNSTNRPLKVVLPPGLVASGATGQMMGMGGMGGGMGGMGGGMGGGMMGGMGGGMGGMMSIPPQDPATLPDGASGFEEQKKRP